MVFVRPYFVLVVLLVGSALTGCLGGPEPVSVPPVEEASPESPAVPDHDFGAAIVDLHDHANPLLHGNGFGLELLGWNDLTEGLMTKGMITGQYNEVDVCGTLAVVGSLAGNRGFTMLDLTDPSVPEVLSHFPTASTNWDVRFSDDCTTVFVGMDAGVLGPQGLPVPYFGLEDTGRGGILVVDVSDPGTPVRESFNAVGSSHNVWSRDIGGITYVWNEDVNITKVVGERGARTLELVTSLPGRHDVAVEAHPVTGVPYLFTGTNGLSIWNMSDPAAVDPSAPDGVLDLPDDDPHTLWHEQTPAPALIDGRWILIGGGEDVIGKAAPYSIVDITDPTAPVLLGDWILPGAPFETRGFYAFSPHNVAIREDGRVALANYHAGIWVIDVSTQERQEAPVTLGYAMPAEVSPMVVRSMPYAPYVWGAAWTDAGDLVIADMDSGLYVYASP